LDDSPPAKNTEFSSGKHRGLPLRGS
jgi:hypothetical protein